MLKRYKNRNCGTPIFWKYSKPTNDEKSKIVFITKNLKSNDLIKTIKVLNFKKQKKNKIDELTFSKKDYTNFVNAMNEFDALTTLDR